MTKPLPTPEEPGKQHRSAAAVAARDEKNGAGAGSLASASTIHRCRVTGAPDLGETPVWASAASGAAGRRAAEERERRTGERRSAEKPTTLLFFGPVSSQGSVGLVKVQWDTILLEVFSLPTL